jgi:hypothetical protein
MLDLVGALGDYGVALKPYLDRVAEVQPTSVDLQALLVGE